MESKEDLKRDPCYTFCEPYIDGRFTIEGIMDDVLVKVQKKGARAYAVLHLTREDARDPEITSDHIDSLIDEYIQRLQDDEVTRKDITATIIGGDYYCGSQGRTLNVLRRSDIPLRQVRTALQLAEIGDFDAAQGQDPYDVKDVVIKKGGFVEYTPVRPKRTGTVMEIDRYRRLVERGVLPEENGF